MTASTSTVDRYSLHSWYEPQTGRYVSPDPLRSVLGEYGDSALMLVPGLEYAYAADNPLLYTDPLGLTIEQGLCVVTRNQQLASLGRGLGLAINAVSYTFFGTNTWTHFVPTFRPCGSHGAPQDDLSADPYYGDDQLKALSTSWRINDLTDQPEIGPMCLWR